MSYTVAESPYSAANILWRGYCELARHGSPMEIQTYMLGVHEATRANGGKMPQWAMPEGAQHFDKTQPVKEDENK